MVDGEKLGPPQGQQDGTKGKSRLKSLLDSTAEFFKSGWMYAIPTVAVFWMIVILIYAIQLPSGVRWGAFATAILIGSSSFLVGGLVGFLFGIPRTVQSATPSASGTHYQGNTNLEQVSDWVTKIIVGVTLVQIGRVIPALARLGEAMKAPLGGQASSAAFGVALTIADVLLGFFLFYLWSRSSFKQELEDLEKKAAQQADQASVDNT
jgi:hypothetical protein